MDRDTKYVILFSILLFFMILLDYIWLNFIAKDLFYSQLKTISGFKDMFYEIRSLKTSLLYFVVGLSMLFFFDPGIKEKDRALLLGVFMGLFIYSTIEFSNYFFYNNYSPVVVCIDILWGIFLFTLASYVIYYFTQKFLTFKD